MLGPLLQPITTLLSRTPASSNVIAGVLGNDSPVVGLLSPTPSCRFSCIDHITLFSPGGDILAICYCVAAQSKQAMCIRDKTNF